MDKPVFKKRILFTGFIISVILFFFVIKLFNLHFSDRITLPDRTPVENGRGYIFDREGHILALSIELDSFYVNPQELADHAAAATELSALTGIPVQELRSRFSERKKFVWLVRKCDERLSSAIKGRKIRGVHYLKEYRRVYPYNSLAANVIGFVGVDNRGLDGIEYKFDGMLSGHDEVVRDEISREVYQKKNLTLTIDRFVQHVAESELHKAMVTHRAAQGSIVVIETGTGRVLALAKYPSFNPNSFYRFTSLERSNFGVVDTFEPGSTIKVIALASLLQNRPDALKHYYQCDGYVDINDVRINCLHVHGKVDMKEIIAKSCNAGMIQSVKSLGKENLNKTLEDFGFGTRTGIELPGEASGILRPVSQWSGLSKYSLSIGHEFSVNTVQLAAAFSAIAGGGVYVNPTLIERIEKPDGTPVRTFYPRTRGRIIRQSDAEFLMKMMRGVVVSGTGKMANSAYYEIAGKTGTSQKFSSEAGGYSDRNVSSFVGIAPYQNPRVCVAVVIDDPEDRYTGGTSAAPVLMRIINRILPYYGVGGKDISSLKVKSSRDRGTGSIKYMPDLKGFSMAEASEILRVLGTRYGVKYYIKGTGKVYAQKPAAGSAVTGNDTVVIFMK